MKTVVIQAQQKWECQAVVRHSETALADAVTDAGQDGWELVGVIHFRDSKGSAAWAAFLKRPSTGGPVKGGGETALRASHAVGAGPASQPTVNPPGFDLDGEAFDVKHE